VPGVAHVQAENIRAREDQIPDHNIRIRSRPERANDFGFAHAPINRLVAGLASRAFRRFFPS
jgi:hypothetical protein